MSYQQRTIILSLITSLALMAWFGTKFIGQHASGSFSGPDGAANFGWFLLTYIGISIAAIIATTVLGQILISILSGESEPDFTSDERDHAYELRGVRVMAIVAGIALIGAVWGLTQGLDPVMGLGAAFLGFAFGDMAGNITRLISYARA